MHITAPTLLLDEEICRSNIARMAAKARGNQLIFRPHFKTHVSAGIGEWFKNEGIDKITVSSVSMAEYFAAAGWDDITIAFPVNILEIDKINRLAGQISLNLLVESLESVAFLHENLQHPVGIFIKIDVDYYRTGVSWKNHSLLESLFQSIPGKFLQLKGILTHAGHSYAARGASEILEIHQSTITKMNQVKDLVRQQHPDLIVSIGDTPTCSVAEDFAGVDEIRPGNFVFYDLMQQQIGACSYEQIAVLLACPVVALHPERNEFVVYGGGVHFSKDRLQHDKWGTYYGLATQFAGDRIGTPYADIYLHRLSQEHGIVKAPKVFINQLSIGEISYFLPIHSCMTSDLFSHILTTRGRWLSRM